LWQAEFTKTVLTKKQSLKRLRGKEKLCEGLSNLEDAKGSAIDGVATSSESATEYSIPDYPQAHNPR
jgi:DNA polymerase II large subunit